MQHSYYEILFASFAFILGAAIGSFLNVCIYRMPRDLSVNNPRRSFCPHCKYQIPWWRNLPLISWLTLRGKCANCGAPIPFRYFGVELLTGLLFLAVWWKVGWQNWILALPYWLLVCLFVVATFIDFEFFIIPDEITWGGAAAGIGLSFVIPMLHGSESHLMGGVWAAVGAVAGYALLWAVVELGKKAFGKKQFKLVHPTPFTWTRRLVEFEGQQVSDADLVVGDVGWKELPPPTLSQRLRELFGKSKVQRGESWLWSDMFMRESDRLVMKCPDARVDQEEVRDATLEFSSQELTAGGRRWVLDKVDVIRGTVSSLIVPREAMGFGDVKFLACIGAFLGWKAVLFTVMLASVVGAAVGIFTIAIGRREWSAKIPFGPYLALGALVWLFAGPELVDWYLNLALRGSGGEI